MRNKVIEVLMAMLLLACLLTGCGVLTKENRTEKVQTSEQGTTQADEDQEDSMPGDEQAFSESGAEAEKTGYFLRYEGFDTGVKILFQDCVCEYDKDDSRVYTYFVDDPAVAVEGYAIYVQTPEDTMEIFPVKDYRVDRDAGHLYMIWGLNAYEGFDRIQGVRFVDGMGAYKIMGSYNMEELIAETYGLEPPDDEKDFTIRQVTFTGLYEENGKTVLRGKASALHHDTEKEYSVEWKIDTESLRESAKAYLTDFDIHPLYAAFLRNEIRVKNPFVPENSGYNTELSFEDDKEYWAEEDVFRSARKSFALVDVNCDGDPELVFRMTDSPSELLYIMGVQDSELTCYYIDETHTTHMGFFVYDNGNVERGQNYDGEEEIYYTFTEDGKEQELIHFIREADSDSNLLYDYYYVEGNDETRIRFQSDEEYEALVSLYRGEEPKWFDCETFADISQDLGILEMEVVEKNAKNTGALRISTSITKLWLKGNEEGVAEINAALRGIYKEAEDEMEAFNREVLEYYLFEDGVLRENLEEWIFCPLEEWLTFTTENYVTSIEYVDEDYLCLCRTGDHYVAGGAHGYYWDDYYVFDRHTGQRLYL